VAAEAAPVELEEAGAGPAARVVAEAGRVVERAAGLGRLAAQERGHR
jgi:hypothetical protein